MIIGIAGRKGSGKSAASSILTELGYKRVSFADYLKECCAAISGLTLDSMYSPVLKEEVLAGPILWDLKMCDRLSVFIGEDIPFEKARSFASRREMLQYIGTDVLRKHDPEFHIKKTRERLLSTGNTFVDDMRFPNEKELIEELGGICIFLLRPSNSCYSNHPSEVSLTRSMFDYVLVNDRSERTLKNRFLDFVKGMERAAAKPRMVARHELINALVKHNNCTSSLSEEWGCSRDKVVWWAKSHLIRLSRSKYSLDSDAFSVASPEAAYWAGVLSADGCVKKSGRSTTSVVVELSSNDLELAEGFRNFTRNAKPLSNKVHGTNGNITYTSTVIDPYMADDMKLWNIEPRKSRLNKVPDIVGGDDELIGQWIVGLIDGDGSIFSTNKGCSLCISVIASLEIITFIRDWSGIPCAIHSEKDIDNLFSVRFSGKNAIAIYKKVYRNRGLKRKWDKVLPFITKVWHH